MAETYVSVGKLGKPHGISGAFRFLLYRQLKSQKKYPDYFIVAGKKSTAPQFVQSIEWLKEAEGIVQFEEIKTPEAARQMSGSELMIREKDEAKYFKKDDSGAQFLKGYLAIEEDEGEIGRIAEIIEGPAQTLLTIEDKDVLIPLVEEFILDINKRKKEILLRLPEGLLDL